MEDAATPAEVSTLLADAHGLLLFPGKSRWPAAGNRYLNGGCKSKLLGHRAADAADPHGNTPAAALAGVRPKHNI